MKCKNCQKEINTEFKICPYCGEPVLPIAEEVDDSGVVSAAISTEKINEEIEEKSMSDKKKKLPKKKGAVIVIVILFLLISGAAGYYFLSANFTAIALLISGIYFSIMIVISSFEISGVKFNSFCPDVLL